MAGQIITVVKIIIIIKVHITTYVVAAFPKLIHSRQDALVGGGKKNQVNKGNSIWIEGGGSD